MSVLSLYIPIISDVISEVYVKKMFKNKNIGNILKVDFVKNKVKNRREAFVHFDEWFDNDDSKKFKNDVLNPDTKTQFKYNDSGKFWPILVNKNPHKRSNNPNYEVLKKSEMLIAYKESLNTQTNNKNKNNKNDPKSYANVCKKSKN
tara:strand:+ start:7289 stop:7729 length:441 start_codon:yes stop_codon:yes gene_type:complete